MRPHGGSPEPEGCRGGGVTARGARDHRNRVRPEAAAMTTLEVEERLRGREEGLGRCREVGRDC